ncbi:MAG TPA: hypothetical protein VK087_02190 [Tissierellaceae bacterium]|nr:hypothetical protein [Tissierellaceae bacterium]
MTMNFEEILRELNEKANDISMDNEKISKLIEDAKKKIESNEAFSEVADDMKESIEMIKVWKNKKYNDISQNTILTIIAGLIYIVNPLGVVPKFLKKVPLGEVLVTAYILKKVKEELEEYRVWKSENSTNVDDSDTVYIKL